ncbi:MAG: Fe-S cluster assembly protein SufD [Candidatus Latescibacteria bacterium]|jgi:Fe-S cluster assembly protein SufD|nr:Fe-S cluster assembly protein SufD [Candidatus Latescibacterota bacterium]
MTQVSEHIANSDERYVTYRTDYEELKKAQAPLWLHQLRKRAMTSFGNLGLPITREMDFPEREDWMFTNLAPIAKIPFTREYESSATDVSSEDIAPYTYGDDSWTELVFVNGCYSESLSRRPVQGPGIRVETLAEAVNGDSELLQTHLAHHAEFESTGLSALNTAFLDQGVLVHVQAGKLTEHPIHIIHVSVDRGTPTVSHPRILVVADQDSAVTVVESYFSLTDHQYYNNCVTELVTGRAATIDHYRINRESLASYHTSMTKAEQHDDSNISTFNMCMGGALTRNDTHAHLNGEHIVTRMNGIYIVNGSQHVDNHTVMDHAKPNCNSYEVYKGILDGNAHGVFNGKVFVRQDAQETDAKQLNKNLLLSPNASVDTKPQLEIFADQVKCTHGATVGQLDEDQIFYGITRGMSRAVACQLLTYGFAADLVRRLKVEAIRERLDTLFENTIKGRTDEV